MKNVQRGAKRAKPEQTPEETTLGIVPPSPGRFEVPDYMEDFAVPWSFPMHWRFPARGAVAWGALQRAAILAFLDMPAPTRGRYLDRENDLSTESDILAVAKCSIDLWKAERKGGGHVE